MIKPLVIPIGEFEIDYGSKHDPDRVLKLFGGQKELVREFPWLNRLPEGVHKEKLFIAHFPGTPFKSSYKVNPLLKKEGFELCALPHLITLMTNNELCDLLFSKGIWFVEALNLKSLMRESDIKYTPYFRSFPTDRGRIRYYPAVSLHHELNGYLVSHQQYTITIPPR